MDIHGIPVTGPKSSIFGRWFPNSCWSHRSCLCWSNGQTPSCIIGCCITKWLGSTSSGDVCWFLVNWVSIFFSEGFSNFRKGQRVLHVKNWWSLFSVSILSSDPSTPTQQLRHVLLVISRLIVAQLSSGQNACWLMIIEDYTILIYINLHYTILYHIIPYYTISCICWRWFFILLRAES